MLKNITVSIYLILLVLLGAATIIEALQGTEFVVQHIYHTLYFCALWGILSLLSVVILIKYALWKRFPVFLLHVSLLVILAGALTSFVSGQKGYIHLRTGLETSTFRLPDQHQARLPFTVRLDSFKVEHYPGTTAPKDYISYLTCITANHTLHARISMNKIWTSQGYRFYQTSFDKDNQGSILTVNHDPWGTGITYSGYLLLALSMLWVLISPHGTFVRLLRSQLKKSLVLCLLLTTAVTAAAHTGHKLPALNRAQADSLSRIQVIYHDRVTPLNTLARDFLLKIYGKDTYNGLTPEQVVGGWLLSPERWKNEPILRIKQAVLRNYLHMHTDYISLNELFEGETYRLQAPYGKGNQKLDQAIWETDEKVGLISMLLQGTLIKPIANDTSVAPLSPLRIQAELLYNQVPFCKLLFMFNLTVGLLGLVYLFYLFLGSTGAPRYHIWVTALLRVSLYVVTLIHLFNYALYWCIAGHIPLGNGYETMLFMALFLLVFACIARRRYPFIAPFGLLLSGFTLLVAYLGQSNPQITPLMPVLLSPWLSSHVSLIMISYALFAFIWLNGLFALSLLHASRRSAAKAQQYAPRIDQLTILSRILLYPAVCLLGIGIFLGAVWANESWGRYWRSEEHTSELQSLRPSRMPSSA